MDISNVLVIIPAYNPGDVFLEQIKRLISVGFDKIIIVNDGSSEDYDHLFEAAGSMNGCFVLNHAANLGKGRALKMAFNFAVIEFSECVGVVTIDADAQYRLSDIVKCAEKLVGSGSSNLILGCRKVDPENTSFSSRAGIKFSSLIFSFLGGVKASDIQTCLRGIPMKFLRELLTVSGERFDYDLNMIIECGQHGVKISELSLETPYLGKRKQSHFNPIFDSLSIAAVFLKFIISSFSALVVDIAAFAILVEIFRGNVPAHILISTVAARIISSVVNYAVNKRIVFRDYSGEYMMFKYIVISVIKMCLSAGLVSLIFALFKFDETLTKIFVDLVLFFLSFEVQRKWIFTVKRRVSEDEE